MCDNCNKCYDVQPLNVTAEAKLIPSMLSSFERDFSNISLKQAVDICKGRSVPSPQLNEETTAKFKGLVKSLPERDVRRLMLQLLKKEVLKENFVVHNTGQFQTYQSFSVYLLLGKNSNKLLRGDMEISISQGLRPKERDYKVL